MATANDVRALVDHLFRHRAGQMLASLTRILGARHLDLAEEVVQDALVQALRQWPFRGIPDNPTAWLIQAAKNRALDRLRRDARLRAKEPELQRWHVQPTCNAEDGLPDDELRLMFMCCHDALPREMRVALTLKTLGGFGVAEIARAFLANEATIAQRLVRARRKIQDDNIPFDVPGPADLPNRVDAVLEVLYLMFNEGYSAHQGENLVREDLVYEAIRLTDLLLHLPMAGSPKVHALMALMLFQGARLATRVDAGGDLLLLADQDRRQWDQGMIQRGFAHLKEAGRGDVLTLYHLEAGIASCHAMAPSWDATNWQAIVAYYDLLLALNPSPVAALNRSVALAQLHGADAGLRALDALHEHPQLRAYYLLPATRGELLRQRGDHAAAAHALHEALGLASSEPVRRFLRQKLSLLPA